MLDETAFFTSLLNVNGAVVSVVEAFSLHIINLPPSLKSTSK
jgi:hypothetical protein